MTTSSTLVPSSSFPLAVLLSSAISCAQCTPSVLPQGGMPGPNNGVRASTMWDPDGPTGPLSPMLVIAGYFTAVDGVPANHIAAYEPANGTWSALGGGLTGPHSLTACHSLLSAPNGDLIAAGYFDTAGGTPALNIARWNGTSWSPLGAGLPVTLSGEIKALGIAPNGDIVAGGSFLHPLSNARLARFDGTNWSTFSGPSYKVTTMANLPTGELVIGGEFQNVSNIAGTSHLAMWDGTAWSAIGGGVGTGTNHEVRALLPMPNGDLIVGGEFDAVGAGNLPANDIARWDGTSWSTLGAGPSGIAGAVSDLALDVAGNLIAGGVFAPNGGVVDGIARWNGTTWSPIGSGIPEFSCFATTLLPNGDIVAAGWFYRNETLSSGELATGIVRFDGSTWRSMSDEQGVAGEVFDIAETATGDVLICGGFSGVGQATARAIARFDGTGWSALGVGFYWPAHAILPLPNGDIMAGGRIHGATSGHVALWDGTAWSTVGQPGNTATQTVSELALMQNGEVVAAGRFPVFGSNLARWNGSVWLPLGQGVNNNVRVLQPMPNGDLAVSGHFTSAGGQPAERFAIWDGANWTAPPAFANGGAPLASAVLPNGDLVLGGIFSSVGSATVSNIARWDGTNWHDLGGGLDDDVNALCTLPNGDLIVGGEFLTAGGVPAARLARWDGIAWSQFGPGIHDGDVYALELLSDGTLAVGGDFLTVGGQPSNGYVRLPAGCPAAVATTGTNCIGPAGPMVADATALPWLGTTCRSTVSGFATNSIGMFVTGLATQQLPLNQLHPTGLPGCDLLVQNDASVLLFPTNGEASVDLSIPNSAMFIGVVLQQQFVQAGLSAQGALSSLSSSNALELTIGDV